MNIIRGFAILFLITALLCAVIGGLVYLSAAFVVAEWFNPMGPDWWAFRLSFLVISGILAALILSVGVAAAIERAKKGERYG